MNIFYFLLPTILQIPSVSFFSISRQISVELIYKKIHMYFIFSILLLLPTWAAIRWGVMIPPVLFTYSFLLIISSIIFQKRFTLRLTVLLSLLVVIINYYQSTNKLLIHSNWNEFGDYFDDKIIIGIIFSCIIFVTWLIAQEREMAIQQSVKPNRVRNSPQIISDNYIESFRDEFQQLHEDKLQHLSYLAEVGKYLSGLIHDISTPLNVITLNIYEIANSQRFGKPKHNRHNNYSIKRALHSAHVIEHYIDTARQFIQHQQVCKKYSVKQSIEMVLTVLRYKALLANVKIEVICDKNLYLHGNSARFNQMISNLISNAIDSYENNTSNSKIVMLHISKINTSVQLNIQDFGNGISSHHLEHIFLPLFTTKKIKSNMGLGLSIVHEIVEQEMNGTISVHSSLNKGTLFKIVLPLNSPLTFKSTKKSSHSNLEYTNSTNETLSNST